MNIEKKNHLNIMVFWKDKRQMLHKLCFAVLWKVKYKEHLQKYTVRDIFHLITNYILYLKRP